jgi:hypothetical protein
MVYSYLMYLSLWKKSTARLFSSDGPILSFIIDFYITAIDRGIQAGIGYQVPSNPTHCVRWSAKTQ